MIVRLVVDGKRMVFQPETIFVSNGDNLEFTASTDGRRMQARISHTETDLSFGVYDFQPAPAKEQA